MEIEQILKIIENEGGFGELNVYSLLNHFDLDESKFSEMIDQKYGLSNWLEESTKRINQLNGGKGIFLDLSNYYEDGSFVYLKLGLIWEFFDDGLRKICANDNWSLSESKFIFDSYDAEGNLEPTKKEYDFDKFSDFVNDEYPFDFSDWADETKGMISQELSKKLGLNIILGDYQE